jgi:poly-beta-hydroxyalkanoate depolymerase
MKERAISFGLKEAVMIYQKYQMMSDLSDPVRQFAEHAQVITKCWFEKQSYTPLQRMAAYYEQIALMGLTHTRPDFAIAPIRSKEGWACRHRRVPCVCHTVLPIGAVQT